MKWKLIFSLCLTAFIISVSLVISSYDQYVQVKNQVKSQQDLELKFKALERHYQEELREMDTFEKDLLVYQKNFPLNSDYAWLRERVQRSELEFVKYRELKSPEPQVRLLSLSVQGSETQFWRFVEGLRQETPWLKLTAFELSAPKNKGFNIRNLQLSWRLDTKNFTASDSISSQDSLSWESYDWNSKPLIAFRERLPMDISTQQYIPKSLFPKAQSHRKTRSTPQAKPVAFQWPPGWKLEGHVSGRGVSLKIQGKLVFWKQGATLEGLKLIQVNNEGVEIQKPSGSTMKKSW